MLIKIKAVKPLDNFILSVVFDDDRHVLYDMNEDIDTLPHYDDLRKCADLWHRVNLDTSRTCIYWNDLIDLPSDILYEYGITCADEH